MVEYWHWHSIPAGQETYWKGVLSHDLEPNRAYAEVSRTAHELQKDRPAPGRPEDPEQGRDSVEPRLGQRHQLHALRDDSVAMDGCRARPPVATTRLVAQLHRSLYEVNVGADFVFPETAGFLGIQAADRARALHLRRCAAAARSPTT